MYSWSMSAAQGPTGKDIDLGACKDVVGENEELDKDSGHHDHTKAAQLGRTQVGNAK